MAKRFFTVILAVLVIGTAFAAANPALDGTWFDDDWGDKYVFNNGVLEISDEHGVGLRATYTTSGDNIALKVTHVRGSDFESHLRFWLYYSLSSELYSRAELESLVIDVIVDYEGPFSPDELAELRAEFDLELDAIFETIEGTYSVTEDRAILMLYGYFVTVLTRE